ncbi:hypothetical protein JTE88_00380 [Arcanobacterium phocisimile]|uniref:Beta-lactamase enzyme family protein n=1 Tax=Arcanobacterium phocisimile TaxID=1302235 RepID=A0ABX7IGK9_9ACTO|nr:hypothetical protein [Arcanobacterium phocisimile]QRV02254.1 hypothetical protein JTE88_00380 [Arcanobacterium phocisimile]
MISQRFSIQLRNITIVVFLIVTIWFIAYVFRTVTGTTHDANEAAELAEQAEASTESQTMFALTSFDPSLESLISRVDSLEASNLNDLYQSDLLSEATADRLAHAIETIESTQSQVGFVMVDITTGTAISYNSEAEFYGASTIKGPYIVAISKFLPDSITGSDKALMRQAITVSDNDSYFSLRSNYGDELFAFFADTANAPDINREEYFPHLTPKQLTKLWVENFDYFFVYPNEQADDTREHFTSPYNSFIYEALKDTHPTYTKPGWIDLDLIARNDAGIVETENGHYLLTIMSTAYDQVEELMDLTKALDEIHQELVTSATN